MGSVVPRAARVLARRAARKAHGFQEIRAVRRLRCRASEVLLRAPIVLSACLVLGGAACWFTLAGDSRASDHIDFPAWIATMEVDDIIAMRVGQLVEHIVASLP